MNDRTYIRYSKLPQISFTKRGWQTGKSPSVLDEINVQWEDAEISIIYDEYVNATMMSVWADGFKYLTDPLFKKLSKLSCATLDDVEKILNQSGFKCRNEKIE